jgi:hypothetical protein
MSDAFSDPYTYRVDWNDEDSSIGTPVMRLVTTSKSGLHIEDQEKTFCGLAVKDVTGLPYKSIKPAKANGHSYGDELMKSATCKKCKEKARRKLKQLYFYGKDEKRRLYEDTFRMFRAPRPLPQRKRMGGVNTIMSNVRERVRRKSEEAYRMRRLWTVKTSWGESFISTWGKNDHAAFMLGVNYAIFEVFDAFKLEQYDKFKAQAYADMHELITGEELPDERNEDT